MRRVQIKERRGAPDERELNVCSLVLLPLSERVDGLSALSNVPPPRPLPAGLITSAWAGSDRFLLRASTRVRNG